MGISQLHTGIFPLRSFLLPGESVSLHIFESRYRQLVNAALNNNAPFCIIYKDGITGGKYGSLVHVTKVVNQYATSEMDIVVTCKNVVKLVRSYPANEDQLYQSAVVTKLTLPPYEVSKGVKLAYMDYLDALGKSTIEINDEEMRAASAGVEIITASDILTLLDLSNSDKLNWVKHQLNGSLDKFLIEKLSFLTRLLHQEKTEAGFYLN